MTVGIRTWRSVVAVAALAASAGAQASLTLVTEEFFTGTGLGSVPTILTLSSPGNSTFESGSVGFGNVITGDAKTGQSQTHTYTLGELGVTSAASLRVVFNALEPGNGANGITLDNLVLNIFNPTGDLLFTSGAFSPVTFASTQTGTGNSGFLFALDAEQQGTAAAAFGAGFQNNIVALTASAGCTAGSPDSCLGATGGFETFFVTNAAVAAPVPEPSTVALMLAGLAAVAYLGRRRMAR